MSKLKRHWQKKLPTAEQLEQGLFIDFEGWTPNKMKRQKFLPPALLGFRTGTKGPVEYVVFSKKLFGAAKGSGLAFTNWEDHLREIIVGKPKWIFAFSEHELVAFRSALGRNRIRPYRNVRAIAKKHFPGEWPKEKPINLAAMAKAARLAVPENYGRGDVTTKLNRVAEYGSSIKKWNTAPADVRADWAAVLDHNAFDVTAMAGLLEWIRAVKDESG